ncbi:solute carrier family 2, facilitated glucose transporter member 8-like [Dermacentor variabilis]|uniref:solute carrier family 2, facilitated glucose transporter member 8-like n=1 Tax=Dermacentor variabilis TaxID=34621 RepID=UPI003F5CA1A9
MIKRLLGKTESKKEDFYLGRLHYRFDAGSVQPARFLLCVQFIVACLGGDWKRPAILAPGLASVAARSTHLLRFRKTWLGSVLTVAALAGSLVSGFLIERFGRVRPIQLSSLGFVGGCLCIALCNASLPWMFAGRVLTGFWCGLVSLAVPVFVAEISPPHVRGLLGFGVQLAITLGVLVAFVDGKWLDWLAPLCCVPRAPCSWPSPRTPPPSPSAGW